VHEFDANESGLRRVERFEPEHRPGDPFHGPMIRLHDIIEIFDLTAGSPWSKTAWQPARPAAW
jgi:hypothetical protein